MKTIKCGSCGSELGIIESHYLFFGEFPEAPIQFFDKYCNRASGLVTIECKCGNNVDVDTFLERTPIKVKQCKTCHSLAADACRHPKSICKGSVVRPYGSCGYYNEEEE